jgi:hypothetical protein
MATGRDYSAHQRGIINRYYEHQDTIILQRLAELVSELAVADPGKARRLWESTEKALSRTSADPARVKKILSERKVEALATLVNELSAAKAPLAPRDPPGAPAQPHTALQPQPPQPRPPQPQPQPNASLAPPAEAIGPKMRGSDPHSPETLHAAMKAFRKRLKLTRLDAESKLGRNPLSSGRASGIVAIMPPREFTREVWDELVRQGQLRAAGSGFYELVE